MTKSQPSQVTTNGKDLSYSPDHTTQAKLTPISAKELDTTNADAAAGMRWSTTPKPPTLPPEEQKERQQALETYWTGEENEKIKAKGINPLLKAEMEMGKKSREGGFWSKVAGTAMGGGLLR